jgi:hypothetical protein
VVLIGITIPIALLAMKTHILLGNLSWNMLMILRSSLINIQGDSMKKLHTIIKKCAENRHPEWCGCLRPAEIVRLMNSGMIKIDKFHEVAVERAKADKAQGICNSTWFYFYPNDEFKELHRGLKR